MSSHPHPPNPAEAEELCTYHTVYATDCDTDNYAWNQEFQLGVEGGLRTEQSSGLDSGLTEVLSTHRAAGVHPEAATAASVLLSSVNKPWSWSEHALKPALGKRQPQRALPARFTSSS